MKEIKVIQSGHPRTGSTLLLNLIHGFLAPKDPIQWYTEIKINDFFITKTHNVNVDTLTNQFNKYKLFFVMSERYDEKVKGLIDNRYRSYNNVLIFNYNSLCETNKLSLYNIIEGTFDKLFNFFPSEILPNKNPLEIKENMLNRLSNMNKMVEEIKDKSFDYWEPFYGIHGHHRNRNEKDTY